MGAYGMADKWPELTKEEKAEAEAISTRCMEQGHHGSPFDRGSADSWYSRPRKPHWYPNGTYKPPEITEDQMSEEEIRLYHLGYSHNEAWGGKKSWA